MDKKAGNPYLVLTIILTFYLLAQIFQQYVLGFSSISNPASEEQAFLFGQHWLNYTRLGMILFSMFLMVIAWVIIFFHFYPISSFWSLSALILLVFFCLFEIFYRSVELFMVVPGWGEAILSAQGDDYAKLLSQHRMFDSIVSAIYFPLLFSQLLGSLILIYLSGRGGAVLFMIAMILNAVRLTLRLSGYIGFPELNIFSGLWYFPPVALIFFMLIVWSCKEFKNTASPHGL